MKSNIEAGRVVIDLPLLKKPRPSKSGKSTLLATTRGIRKASFLMHGKTVYINVNVFIRNDSTDDAKQTQPRKRQPKTPAKQN